MHICGSALSLNIIDSYEAVCESSEEGLAIIAPGKALAFSRTTHCNSLYLKLIHQTLTFQVLHSGKQTSHHSMLITVVLYGYMDIYT